MRSLKTLRVLPNPWLHLHPYADGIWRPCCVVACDPVEHSPVPGRYVGAMPDVAVETVPAATLRVGRSVVRTQRSRHDLYWKFATEPVEIPNTGYYRDQIRQHALVAADAETAQAAGVKFVEPAQVLETEKAAATASFDALYGEGSWTENEAALAALEKAQAEQRAAADKAEPQPIPQPAAAETKRAQSRSKDAT